MSSNIQTSCRDCGAEYGGNAGHCKACHRTFGSDSAFDRHLLSLLTAGCHHDLAALRTKAGNPILQWNDRRQLWTCWVDPEQAEQRLAAFRSQQPARTPA